MHPAVKEKMEPRQGAAPIFCRTRLAPTPSGYLHLGNVLSFVLTVALARRTGAAILLRIDDLDKERTTPAYLQDIFDTLLFLELPWDEGPKSLPDFTAHFSQWQRMHLYNDALLRLKENPQIFACSCSRQQIQKRSKDGSYPGTCRATHLPLDTPGAAWRVHTPDDASFSIRTLEGMQPIAGFPASIRDFVVRKKNGVAAYQLASLIDDLYFGVDLVVRGADLWPSTLAQVYLSTLLPQNNFSTTTFLHHLLLLGSEGEKLSKSSGATSVHYLRKCGKTKAEVYQLLAGLCGIKEPVHDWQTLAAALEVEIGVLRTPF
jgi:glutamyl-tRNA synthetase